MNQVPQRKDLKGFTLIELLVVMAILVLLTAAAGPAFNAIMAARGVDSGASNVADFLEMARTEAVTRQTYVWVGISGTDTSGNQTLQMAAAFSVNGSGVDTSSTNVRPFTRLLQVQNVAFTPWSSLKTSTTNSWTAGTPADVYPATPITSGTFGFIGGGVHFTNGLTNSPNAILTYTPQGQLTMSGTANWQSSYGCTLSGTFSPFFGIALRQSHGTAIPPPGNTAAGLTVNDAAVVIDAATGATTIVELH